eukprot:1157021-Pelagomonas_calceolata.AAC.7
MSFRLSFRLTPYTFHSQQCKSGLLKMLFASRVKMIAKSDSNQQQKWIQIPTPGRKAAVNKLLMFAMLQESTFACWKVNADQLQKSASTNILAASVTAPISKST